MEPKVPADLQLVSARCVHEKVRGERGTSGRTAEDTAAGDPLLRPAPGKKTGEKEPHGNGRRQPSKKLGAQILLEKKKAPPP